MHYAHYEIIIRSIISAASSDVVIAKSLHLTDL